MADGDATVQLFHAHGRWPFEKHAAYLHVGALGQSVRRKRERAAAAVVALPPFTLESSCLAMVMVSRVACVRVRHRVSVGTRSKQCTVRHCRSADMEHGGLTCASFAS